MKTRKSWAWTVVLFLVLGAPAVHAQATLGTPQGPAPYAVLPGAAAPAYSTPLPAPGYSSYPIHPDPSFSGMGVDYSYDEGMDQGRTPWLDNFSIFLGIDGAKQPIEMGISANLGYRAAFNWGLPLWEELGLGLQIGSAINHANNATRFLGFVAGSDERITSFTTLGLFRRGESWNLGLGYDFRYDDYFTNLTTGQVRYQIGYNLTENSEVGMWATQRVQGDTVAIAGQVFGVRPINQWNFYWRQVWENQIATRFWVGLAEEHGRVVLVLPPEPRVRNPITFGADIFVPLTCSLALFGEAQFITPNDTGTVTATLGVAWFPGSARTATRSRFAPVMPLANNPSFALDFQR